MKKFNQYLTIAFLSVFAVNSFGFSFGKSSSSNSSSSYSKSSSPTKSYSSGFSSSISSGSSSPSKSYGFSSGSSTKSSSGYTPSSSKSTSAFSNGLSSKATEQRSADLYEKHQAATHSAPKPTKAEHDSWTAAPSPSYRNVRPEPKPTYRANNESGLNSSNVTAAAIGYMAGQAMAKPQTVIVQQPSPQTNYDPYANNSVATNHGSKTSFENANSFTGFIFTIIIVFSILFGLSFLVMKVMKFEGDNQPSSKTKYDIDN